MKGCEFRLVGFIFSYIDYTKYRFSDGLKYHDKHLFVIRDIQLNE